MIPLLESATIQQWATHTASARAIQPFALMEQASRAFVQAFCLHYPPTYTVYIVAGTGHNGGDGLCVARFLKEQGYTVHVFLFGTAETASPLCQQALKLWKADKGTLTCFQQAATLQKITPLWTAHTDSLWIDALFGTGLNRPLEGAAKALVVQLNALPIRCVAIDTPSGLMLDKPQGQAIAVQADHIISLQLPKRAFLLPEQATYVGKWETVDVGFDKAYLADIQATHGYLLEETDLRTWLTPRPRNLHKGQAGRVLLVAGSTGMFGAAILSATAAMRGGAGIVHVHVPKDGVNPLHASVPEVLVQADMHPTYTTHIPIPKKLQAIAIGPGMGQQLPTAASLRRLFNACQQHPLIVDADALNLMAQYAELLAALPADSLLTPHTGELLRLIGQWSDDYDKLQRVQSFCKQHACTMLLKGAYTTIASADTLWFNPTGHVGMATAGSGDVLTGILLALRGTGRSTLKTAAMGAFLHGRAGELAAQHTGSYSLIARDIIKQLPAAFLSIGAA